MKTAKDPRHKNRKSALAQLFTWSFDPKQTPTTILAKKVLENLPEIDAEISQNAVERPIDQISKIDLSILRLAIFELIILKDKRKDQPPFRVIIDEAVELAKEFGGDASPQFINGVLGKLVEKYNLERS